VIEEENFSYISAIDTDLGGFDWKIGFKLIPFIELLKIINSQRANN
jgi:hypothetical protein